MRKYWTKEEEKYLDKYWGKMEVCKMAKYLGRSNDAVRNKARKMGLGNINESVNGIPFTEIPEIVGVNYNSIKKAWREHGLKVQKIGNVICYVKYEDLYDFMRKNPKLWNPSKCDKTYFRGQKWFEEIRNDKSIKRYRLYTESEKIKLIALREVKCLTFQEIAYEFGLSSDKLAHKYYKRWKRQMLER